MEAGLAPPDVALDQSVVGSCKELTGLKTVRVRQTSTNTR